MDPDKKTTSAKIREELRAVMEEFAKEEVGESCAFRVFLSVGNPCEFCPVNGRRHVSRRFSLRERGPQGRDRGPR